MSVYELTEHPDFDFLPGDTVLKLGGGTRWLGVIEDVLEDGTLRVDCWVERFDRRGIEPFEFFAPECSLLLLSSVKIPLQLSIVS